MLKIGNKKATASSGITVIGVTGTLGKTIVTHLIHHILISNGFKTGYISSEGYFDGTKFKTDFDANELTSKNLNDFFSSLKKHNFNFAVIEVTSKNIEKKIYKGLQLDSGIITNILGVEQLYGGWESYAATKLDFINYINNNGLLVINGEDKRVIDWISLKSGEIKNDIFCYWVNPEDLQQKYSSFDGSSFLFNGQLIQTKLPGVFNFVNVYLATQICLRYLTLEQISSAVQSFEPLPGRLHLFTKNPFTIILDQSINPLHVKQILLFIKSQITTKNKIITVFGGTGNYNKHYRKTGNELAELADIILLASNDPDTEQTNEINSEIINYASEKGGIVLERFYSSEEVDMADKTKLVNRIEKVLFNGDVPIISFDAHDYTGRLDAIRMATFLAKPGDFIIIFGKGNQRQIIFDNVEYEWSDYEAVRIAMGVRNI